MRDLSGLAILAAACAACGAPPPPASQPSAPGTTSFAGVIEFEYPDDSGEPHSTWTCHIAGEQAACVKNGVLSVLDARTATWCVPATGAKLSIADFHRQVGLSPTYELTNRTHTVAGHECDDFTVTDGASTGRLCAARAVRSPVFAAMLCGKPSCSEPHTPNDRLILDSESHYRPIDFELRTRVRRVDPRPVDKALFVKGGC